MNQMEDIEKSYLPYSAMSVCFCLLNEARGYIGNNAEMESAQVLTQFINHFGTLTTHDFQIEISDLYRPVEPYMDIDSNVLVNVVWNYGSHFLNLLHPQYHQVSFLEREKLLESLDVNVVHSFLNYIVLERKMEQVFTKEELLERIYDLQRQKQKVILKVKEE